MPRRPRTAAGGIIFHLMNRAARQLPLFQQPGDYDAFVEILRQAQERQPVPLFAYCIMPNHWHLLAQPGSGPELSQFMAWLTMTHAVRWRTAHGTRGKGAVYQGRFQAIPVQDDKHFLTVCRYIERNPIRAGLVTRAEQWPWSSGAVRRNGNGPCLAQWPILKPHAWDTIINTPESSGALDAVRGALRRGEAFGDPAWVTQIGGCDVKRRGRPPSRSGRRRLSV